MKKIKSIYSVLAAAATLFASGVSVLNVNAEIETRSMHVSPPYQRMILVPGESYSDSIVVSNANDSTRNLKYELSIGSFSENSGENGKDDYESVDHISVSSYNQIMDWITLDRTGGTVKPNEKDVVTYTINVPENAPAGGQYATILVEDVTDRDEPSNGNVVIQNSFQFGHIIYAEIAGETKQTGAITENNVSTFNFNTPLAVSSMVENNGNVHTEAEYTLEIWPLFSDEEVYTNVETPRTSLILPETKRFVTQTWDEAPMVGIFRVKQTVKIFGETSIVEKVVIICPLWLLFVIIVAIVLIAIWIVMRVKARKAARE